MNLNKSLADELNQPTSFPTARSNKKIRKPNEVQNPITPPQTVMYRGHIGWASSKLEE